MEYQKFSCPSQSFRSFCAYFVFTGEGQLYTFMVLISEMTTPEINMRWHLDISGLKRSNVYLINGVFIFFGWLMARILLFVYMFHHVYIHYSQVIQMHSVGYFLVFVVPCALSIMNLMWFGKIIKGLIKMLAKKQWGTVMLWFLLLPQSNFSLAFLLVQTYRRMPTENRERLVQLLYVIRAIQLWLLKYGEVVYTYVMPLWMGNSCAFWFQLSSMFLP